MGINGSALAVSVGAIESREFNAYNGDTILLANVKAIELSNAGGANNFAYAVQTGVLAALLTYILAVGGSKLGRMHGTTQGITCI